MRLHLRIFSLPLFLIVLSAVSPAQDVVIEESTEKEFLREVTLSHDSTEYTLTATGTTVRKKFFFKVYGMVHYMEDPQSGSVEEVIQSVLTEEKAKQIVMDFSRDVGGHQIQDAYRDGFKENATEEELKTIQADVDSFVNYYSAEIKENDQLLLRWLPGGTVVAIIKGEEQPPITNPTFARVLWTIWFGPDSIVDPEELVSLFSREE
ncbi:MAG: chalcone isomerase family protein [Bacteroidota bacterium]